MSVPSARMLGRRGRAAVLLVGLLAGVALPSGVAAHVTRTVGPYTVLVILVGEPYFEDNHAGFQFWVRRDDTPVLGLEKTIQAQATGHGVTIDLAVPPLNGAGFHVLDRTTTGDAFDPRDGGAWSLVLSGRIEGTQVLETIPVTFPSYPRIGSAATTEAPPVPAPAGGVAIWLLVGAAMAVGLLRRLRSHRPRLDLESGAAPPV